MQNYSSEYPSLSLGESILPDSDYLPKPEDFVQALKLSDADMGFYPNNAGASSSFGDQFGLPHVPVALPRNSPMGSMLSGHSSNSGANLLLLQKIDNLQNQVYALSPKSNHAQTHSFLNPC